MRMTQEEYQGYLNRQQGEAIPQTKPKRPRQDIEHQEQVALIQRCNLNLRQYPELRLLFAIPNGGHRDERVAAKLKAEGVKPGCPDLMLPVQRCGKAGLFIEMKSESGRVTQEQRQWLKDLTEQGYQTAVCYGQETAWLWLTRYLDEEIDDL